MAGKLDGRVALVTGSGRGIGRAIALALAEEGARVVVNARTKSAVDEVTAEIIYRGGMALGVPADVSNPDQVEAMVRRARRTLGPVDILIANAGIPGPAAFAQEITPDEFLETIKINLWGTFLCIKYTLPGMIERRFGRIVTVTGAGASRPSRGLLPYGSSKAGIEGLTRNLATEIERFGVTCNCIAPGRVDTPGFPMPPDQVGGQVVGPEHAARLAVWLASDDAAKVNGEIINAPDWDRQRQGQA